MLLHESIGEFAIYKIANVELDKITKNLNKNGHLAFRIYPILCLMQSILSVYFFLIRDFYITGLYNIFRADL